MIGSYETIRVLTETTTPDLLVWRRYKMPAPGILEAFLAANPQIHPALARGPYMPVGAIVRMPIDSDVLQGRPSSVPVTRLYGDA